MSDGCEEKYKIDVHDDHLSITEQWLKGKTSHVLAREDEPVKSDVCMRDECG